LSGVAANSFFNAAISYSSLVFSAFKDSVSFLFYAIAASNIFFLSSAFAESTNFY
jgi:hypothetical protein